MNIFNNKKKEYLYPRQKYVKNRDHGINVKNLAPGEKLQNKGTVEKLEKAEGPCKELPLYGPNCEC